MQDVTLADLTKISKKKKRGDKDEDSELGKVTHSTDGFRSLPLSYSRISGDG